MLLLLLFRIHLSYPTVILTSSWYTLFSQTRKWRPSHSGITFTRNGGNATPKHAGPEAKGSNATAGLTLLWAPNPFRGNFNHWQVSRKEAGHIFFKRQPIRSFNVFSLPFFSPLHRLFSRHLFNVSVRYLLLCVAKDFWDTRYSRCYYIYIDHVDKHETEYDTRAYKEFLSKPRNVHPLDLVWSHTWSLSDRLRQETFISPLWIRMLNSNEPIWAESNVVTYSLTWTCIKCCYGNNWCIQFTFNIAFI